MNLNTEITLLASVASLLFGSLLTILVFLFKFVGRVVTVEANLIALGKAVNDLTNLVSRLPTSIPSCQFHVAVDRQLGVNTERLDQLETWRDRQEAKG
jgi:hypothetical protein